MATTSNSPLSLHDALPISRGDRGAAPALSPRRSVFHPLVQLARRGDDRSVRAVDHLPRRRVEPARPATRHDDERSEEHTSELQSHVNLVCRLLLEKKKK